MKLSIRFSGLALLLMLAGITLADDTKQQELIKQIDAMMDKALKAYNDNDAKKFYADFVKNLRESKDKIEDFGVFFHDENKEKFGKYVSRKINKDETILEDDLMVVRYVGEFEKKKKISIIVSLAKEEGKPRFKLIQFVEE